MNKVIKCHTCTYYESSLLFHVKYIEVVEKELFKDDDAFELFLSRLQSLHSCPFNDFYRKRHTYSKCKQN